MAFDEQGRAEGHDRKRVQRDPRDENKKLLSTFGSDKGWGL